MKILMALLNKSFPPDIRVEKECSSLIDAGHEVFLLTMREDKQPKSELWTGIKIFRLLQSVSFPFVARYLIHCIQLPLVIPEFVIAHGIKVIHTHDLPYAIPMAFIGKILRCKTVSDMHEHYVGLVEPGLRKEGKIGSLLIFLLRIFEVVTCKLSTKVIVVVDENEERLTKLGVQDSKIIVVSNTADVQRLEKLEDHYAESVENQGKFVISYVGGLSPHRGLDILLKAMPLILKEAPNVHLLLVGDGKIRSMLEEMSNRLGVREHVAFTGWLSFNKAMKYLQMCDLGVVPYHSTPLTNHTVPHKIFQYMFFRKPILVSDVKPLKKVVKATKCGFIFRAGEHVQLADKVLEAIKDPQLVTKLGENGRKAVEEKYNWGLEKLKLIAMYDKIAKPSGE